MRGSVVSKSMARGCCAPEQAHEVQYNVTAAQKRKLLAKLVGESVPEAISNVHSTASLHRWGT